MHVHWMWAPPVGSGRVVQWTTLSTRLTRTPQIPAEGKAILEPMRVGGNRVYPHRGC
jgi:hypothetical protein